jgi:hypothetical protein
MFPRRFLFVPIGVCALVAAASSGIAGQRPADADRPQLKAAPLPDGVAAPTIDGRITDEAWLGIEPYATSRKPIPTKARRRPSGRRSASSSNRAPADLSAVRSDR